MQETQMFASVNLLSTYSFICLHRCTALIFLPELLQLSMLRDHFGFAELLSVVVFIGDLMPLLINMIFLNAIE